jgi:predicted TIM-barrel fold metal-dependent hydrolase
MNRSIIPALVLTLATASIAPSRGQVPSEIREMKLRDWDPQPVLMVKATAVSKPKFPVIDVHNHLGGGKATLTPQRVSRYLEEMDASGVQTVVNLDGGWDERLVETVEALDKAHPGRFLTFALINFEGIDEPGWTDRERTRLETGFKAGAKGLKIHKTLGLGHRYKDGRLVPVDDPRLDPLWELCGLYNRPVVIHTGDPGAFFTPLDQKNERWHELNEHPDWLFYGKDFPSRAELHAQRLRVIERHPRTKFLCAHMANDGEDLATLAAWLDRYPNMYVDIDARIAELGRQPYSARRFLIKYQDRVAFGTDTSPNRNAYRTYFRFLETDDEYFNPARGHHVQGFWMIYGVFLPDDVLAKIYNGNARKILYGLPESGPRSGLP